IHASAILQLPGFALQLFGAGRRWPISVSGLLVGGLLFVAGCSVWLYLPLRSAASPPFDFAREIGLDLTLPRDFWLFVSADAYRDEVFRHPVPRVLSEFGTTFGWFWQNELGFGAIIGLLGWGVQFRRDRLLALGLGLGFVLHFLFFT